MSEVIDFMSFRSQQEERDVLKTEEAVNALQREERADVIRTRIRKRPKMKAMSDRLVAAQNLWNILDRVEKDHKVRKARVFQEAGQGAAEESTKRLPKFAMRPNLPPEEIERRKKILSQTTRHYLTIAEHAAILAGFSKHEYVEELVRGTGYERDVGEPDGIIFEPWVKNMAGMLNKIGEWINHRHDLEKYYDLLSGKWRFSFDPNLGRTEERRQYRYEGPFDLRPISSYDKKIPEGKLVFSHRLNHIPSIRLARISVTDDAMGSEEFSGCFYFPGRDGRPTKDTIGIECKLETAIEFRLAMAPIGPNGHALPAIQKQIVTTIYDRDRNWIGDFEGYPVDDPAARDEEGLYKYYSRKRDEWYEIDELDSGDVDTFYIKVPSSSVEEINYDAELIFTGYSIFRKIDLSSCQKYLSMLLNNTNQPPGEWLLYDLMHEAELAIDSPENTLGSAMERNLYWGGDFKDPVTGQPRDIRIDTALDEEVAARCAALQMAVEKREADLLRAQNQAFSRWDNES